MRWQRAETLGHHSSQQPRFPPHIRQTNAGQRFVLVSSDFHPRRDKAMLWWIIVGLVAGWLAGKLVRGKGFGILADIVLGILGAIIGGWIMGVLGFAGRGGLLYTILVATLGAVVLVWFVHAIKGK